VSWFTGKRKRRQHATTLDRIDHDHDSYLSESNIFIDCEIDHAENATMRVYVLGMSEIK
jgi:hypothetical protein